LAKALEENGLIKLSHVMLLANDANEVTVAEFSIKVRIDYF